MKKFMETFEYNNDNGNKKTKVNYLSIKDTTSTKKIMFLQEFNEIGMEFVHASVERKLGNGTTVKSDLRCIGKKHGCPLCIAGTNPSKKLYFPIYDLTETDDSKSVKLFVISAGKANINVNNLHMVWTENGTIRDIIWGVKRNGMGLDTTYTFMPGKQSALPDGIDCPDIEEIVSRIPESSVLLQQPATSGDDDMDDFTQI